MWIRNTSRYPDDRVIELVTFASRDVDMDGVCVNVRNGELAGGAYNGVPEISNAPSRRIPDHPAGRKLSQRWPMGPVNYHFKAPHETGPRNRFPFFTFQDWSEWLVKLAAHEAKHIEQFRAGDVCSELSCERFAIGMLEQFRARRLDGAVGEPSRPLQLALPGV